MPKKGVLWAVIHVPEGVKREIISHLCLPGGKTCIYFIVTAWVYR